MHTLSPTQLQKGGKGGKGGGRGNSKAWNIFVRGTNPVSEEYLEMSIDLPGVATSAAAKCNAQFLSIHSGEGVLQLV